ncbi:hypothetical protein GR158_24995 [Shinella sp. AETb1-6]|uniref:zinc ribbon domain-containing protein n=1 Tax=Shinella sp. AETb1-6 TaxID=2692210 RepID=UPI001371D774|nr:hypothetical protein [Shinella sp. AETb1-6]
MKERQLTTLENFSRTTTNRLNRAHRPSYLLSGMLECAECGDSYAIMAKERYGCSNHKNKLPIDGLDGAYCSNKKTILRKNLEDRVLSCLRPSSAWVYSTMSPDRPARTLQPR